MDKNYKIYELKKEVFERDGYVCLVCGRSILLGQSQLAHIIPQKYIKIYGDKIIHHPLNLKSTCCLRCNAAVSISGKQKLIDDLVKKIKNELKKLDK